MQNRKISLTALHFLVIVLLVLGVFFRFTNLDRKVYWRDEVTTSLRVSGYTSAEMIQEIYNGPNISPEDLQKYQRPNSKKNLADTIRSLAVEDPQHPPLYYIMAYFWATWFGNSVTTMRSLPSLISLLVFPCIYWLCRELFDSLLVGEVALALIAVSLVHVMYAHEAREFSLWTVTILLLSASLLRTMRLTTKVSWGIYATTVAIGLYTLPLTGLVVIGHGIYVLAMEGFRLTKTFISYVVASLVGFIAFTPWLLVFLTNISTFQETTAHITRQVPLRYLVDNWVLNISYIFISVRSSSSWPFTVLAIYAIYFVFRYAPKRVWLFISTLTIVPALTLVGLDLIEGGHRSTTLRYLFPFHLGIQLSVAYLFTTQITSDSISVWKKRIWLIIIIGVLFGGLWACGRFSQAETGWNKRDYENRPIAHLVNQAQRPLLISEDSSNSKMISLSYLLKPTVRIQLLTEANILKIEKNFTDVFLYNPSESLRAEAEQKYNKKTVLVYKIQHELWKLEETNKKS